VPRLLGPEEAVRELAARLINEPNQSYTGRWPPWTPSEAERLTAEEAQRILAAGWRYDVPASLVAKLERIAGGDDG
jgi:hypothetical protein